MFPHSDHARYFIAGQGNIIFQAHAPFHSPYDGPNSLLSRGEYKTSLVGTLFLGYELLKNPSHHLDVIYDDEFHGALFLLKFQPELIVEGLRQAWSRIVFAPT